MSVLNPKQIQAQVSAIRNSTKNGGRHFAIQSSGSWSGPDRLSINGEDHLVLPCVSDLQIREALLRAEKENLPSVLLCSMRSQALGDDVIDRLAKRRVFAPQVREMVAELFAVSPARIDPRVLKNKVLMNHLLEWVPPEGYQPVASGTLDLQTAWLTVLSRLVGKKIESPSLTHFLEWSTDAKILRRIDDTEQEVKDALIDWFARMRGESIRFMFAAIDSGFGEDLIPLGAALGLVFDDKNYRSSEHQSARGRLERYFQHKEIDAESARAWSKASSVLLTQIEDTPTDTKRRYLLKRLDELIGELDLKDNAWLSNYSPNGFEQRYRQAGQALRKAVTGKSSSSLDKVRGGITKIQEHILGKSDTERLARVKMACRLVRWLQTTDLDPSGQDLDALILAYHQDGGFIDWARNRLKETDESREVQKAYDKILEQVDGKISSFESAFVLQLQDWTRGEKRSERFTLIEDVLEQIVAPIAKQRPVMLLVLDGMSVAVFRQLLQDILQHEWTEITNDEERLPRPVLATLPSVTSISRRALFLGKLDPGTNGTEEGEFQNNDILFQKSGSQARPKLFKMRDLTDESQGGISSAVRKTIADRRHRVVSVVINAIDDHLDSGKQVDFTWTRDRIRGLRDLLRQASAAERIVLMTSDHGHILDFGTKQLTSSKEGRGDRFRTSTGKTEEGELEFEGNRVYSATGVNRITLACSAAIRYGKSKRGYHGGANPQEMVVPLAILSDARTDSPDDWKEIPPYQPSWWQVDTSEAEPVPSKKSKTEKATEGLELFDQAEEQSGSASTGSSWIKALFGSRVYLDQSKLAVRGAPNEELVTKLLLCLNARGGTAVKQALAQELGLPLFRIDGVVQNVGRILNVDGYEVISFDRGADTVSLNVELLCTQFELKEKP